MNIYQNSRPLATCRQFLLFFLVSLFIESIFDKAIDCINLLNTGKTVAKWFIYHFDSILNALAKLVNTERKEKERGRSNPWIYSVKEFPKYRQMMLQWLRTSTTDLEHFFFPSCEHVWACERYFHEFIRINLIRHPSKLVLSLILFFRNGSWMNESSARNFNQIKIYDNLFMIFQL